MSVPDQTLRFELKALAATCEQMCARLIAARKVIDTVRRALKGGIIGGPREDLVKALEEFDKDNPS